MGNKARRTLLPHEELLSLSLLLLVVVLLDVVAAEVDVLLRLFVLVSRMSEAAPPRTVRGLDTSVEAPLFLPPRR